MLYPNDNVHLGKVLRLKQEYFFVSATLQDIIYNWKQDHDGFKELPQKIAIQLNDTHPALAIPELMRILIDMERFDFEAAWEICKQVFSYTIHTVLPEALERWSVSLFEDLLPRHLMLIYQINDHIMKEVSSRYPGDIVKMRNVSIIEEGQQKSLRMAQLCIHGSHTVNGVAELHTRILRSKVFADFEEMYPGKIQNKTNGITPRLWLLTCNPLLSSLISEHIGNSWIRDLQHIRGIETYIDDADFRDSFFEIKEINKKRLSRYIYKVTGIRVSANSLFDVQIKRMHEYKRQLLNVMGTIARYYTIKDNPDEDFVPRTVIFAGKAAPGYFIAKRLIKLINNLGEIINKDPDIRDRLRWYFCLITAFLWPKRSSAADLLNRFPTAGFEASGTGNMKFALNGASPWVLWTEQTWKWQKKSARKTCLSWLESRRSKRFESLWIQSRSYYDNDPMLKRVVDSFAGCSWCTDESGIFTPIWKSLMEDGDIYFHLADFRAFVEASEKVDQLYKNKEEWVKKAIINIARIGRFSSDRAITEYANDIWNITPLQLDFGG